MNKKYTHIFFDLDNTLWDFNKNSRQAIFETFLEYKLDDQVDFNVFFEVYSKHNDLLWEQYRKKEVHKNELKRQRFQRTLDDLKIEGINAIEMNDRYLEIMPLQTILIAGAIDTLTSLKSRNYKLFIITNGFVEVQHKKMESSGLASFFEKVFISEEIKTPKPGREIFEYAITSTNAKKSKSVMVGDDWDVDIQGALNIGLTAIYFNPGTLKNHRKDNLKYVGDEFFEIDKLMDLLSFL